jgi:hypothetical protein
MRASTSTSRTTRQTLRLLTAWWGAAPTRNVSDRMSTGPLSSTQVAIVDIARGCATLERARRCPTSAAAVVTEVIRAVA